MRVVYALEEIDETVGPAIFLAGPTPRSKEVQSWRPEALEILEGVGWWEGTVFVPETKDGTWKQSYMDQIEWEHKYLDWCTDILMWVPRNLDNMPAFTTNIEFGMYVRGSFPKLWYGRPDGAPNTSYLDYCYKKFVGREPQNTLRGTIVDMLIKDSYSEGGKNGN